MGLIRKFIELNNWICRKTVDGGWVRPDDNPMTVFQTILERVVAENPDFRILEIGGSSRPFLPPGSGSEYVGLDIDPVVADNENYTRAYVQSAEDSIEGQYDLVFNKYVHEHIPDNTRAIHSISQCLADGGQFICLVPCGNHPYSLATRLVGNRCQRLLIRLLRPNFAMKTGYPAFYDHCTPRSFQKLLRSQGMEIDHIQVFWGATLYFNFFWPAFMLICGFNRLAKFCNWQLLASGMVVHAHRVQTDPVLTTVNVGTSDLPS